MAKSKKPKQLRRNCIFCDDFAASGEHIFADWISDYISHARRQFHSARKVYDRDGERVYFRKHPGDPKSRKVNCVCKPCNNEWMSVLQNNAKDIVLPLILAKNISLFRKHLELFASWVTMFVMVLEFAFEGEPPTISKEIRHEFRKTKKPMRGIKIWINRYQGPRSNGDISVSVLPAVSPQKAPERDALGRDLPNTQTTTFVIGELVVHAYVSVHDKMVRAKSAPIPGLFQVWPVRDTPLDWPLSRLLTDVGVQALEEWLMRVANRVGIKRSPEALH